MPAPRGVSGSGGCLVPGGCLVLGGVPGPGGGVPAPGGLVLLGGPGGDPPDGYCCGRYASYWNAFLFIVLLLRRDIFL